MQQSTLEMDGSRVPERFLLQFAVGRLVLWHCFVGDGYVRRHTGTCLSHPGTMLLYSRHTTHGRNLLLLVPWVGKLNGDCDGCQREISNAEAGCLLTSIV